MKILSIDTASDICGVSILENKDLICSLDTNTGRTHSENLMPMIEELFNKTNLSLKDIDLLVCDKGPGSFTGIRIGIATVKAFSDSLDIPCIGISSLESLAYNVDVDGFICSIIDCKNNNCYFSLYNKKDNIYLELIPPKTETIFDALNILKDITKDNDVYFVGNACNIYRNEIKKESSNSIFYDEKFPNCNILNSYHLGLAGLNKFSNNEFDSVLPLYLKKPQAQRILEEKMKNSSIK